VNAAILVTYLAAGAFGTTRDSPSSYAFFSLLACAFFLDDAARESGNRRLDPESRPV
jgi:hypothetical protein